MRWRRWVRGSLWRSGRVGSQWSGLEPRSFYFFRSTLKSLESMTYYFGYRQNIQSKEFTCKILRINNLHSIRLRVQGCPRSKSFRFNTKISKCLQNLLSIGVAELDLVWLVGLPLTQIRYFVFKELPLRKFGFGATSKSNENVKVAGEFRGVFSRNETGLLRGRVVICTGVSLRR